MSLELPIWLLRYTNGHLAPSYIADAILAGGPRFGSSLTRSFLGFGDAEDGNKRK
jgi:hypothetical protein